MSGARRTPSHNAYNPENKDSIPLHDLTPVPQPETSNRDSQLLRLTGGHLHVSEEEARGSKKPQVGTSRNTAQHQVSRNNDEFSMPMNPEGFPFRNSATGYANREEYTLYKAYLKQRPGLRLPSISSSNIAKVEAPPILSDIPRGLSQAGSTLPEASTIDNILDYYSLRSEHGPSERKLRNLARHETDSNVLPHHQQFSAMEIGQQGRGDRAPRLKYPNPIQPCVPEGFTLAKQSHLLGSSNATLVSYGHTDDLPIQKPDIIHQRSLRATVGSSVVGKSSNVKPGRSRLMTFVTGKKIKDHFASRRDPPVSEENGRHDPLPLERQVSNALRHESDRNCGSDGSLDTSANNYVGNSRGIGALQRLKVKEKFRSDSKPTQVQDDSLFDKVATASRYIENEAQREVRIPIVQNSQQHFESPAAPSLPGSHHQRKPSSECDAPTESDRNDWQTVSTSDRQFIVGEVNRTGNSVANYSDSDDESSTVPEIEEYDSTARIVQHPADIGHSNNGYKVRNLKDTNQPVILPARGNQVGSVNGYAADSNRAPTQIKNTNYRPSPMPASHKHPFNSSPPEIKEPDVQKLNVEARYGHSMEAGKQYVSSPLTYQTTFTSDISEISVEQPYVTRPVAAAVAAGSSDNNGSWEDDTVQTNSQPGVTYGHDYFYDTYQNRMMESYNTDGSRLTAPEDVYYRPNGRDLRYQRLNSLHGTPQPQSTRKPSISKTKMAPGGIFNEIVKHSELDRKRKRRIIRTERIPDYFRRHSIPDGMEPVGSQESHNSVFTYRQPSAPPRRQSTLALYHPQQYANDPAHVFAPTELEAGYAAGSRGQIIGPPILFPDDRDYTINTGALRTRRKKIGRGVIALCFFLFPPLLLAFTCGWLDDYIFWCVNHFYKIISLACQLRSMSWSGACTKVNQTLICVGFENSSRP
ncbi:hypothetical protein BJ878DRAFT_168475 [Calycina marina]|uniref:Uncharacterized protein n=1 Tax=Calycina marina TaxID=1763456 RepID=A0A9P8CCY9_9HELO|nr:hypothetical protein BJ878DRAFT_168475 [Calycina marina]